MPKYTVKVEQTNTWIVELDATSEQEASDCAEEDFLNENLGLADSTYQIIVED